MINLTKNVYSKELDKAEVDKAVILGVELAHLWKVQQKNNNYIKNLIRDYPERIIGFVGATPLNRTGRFNRESIDDSEQAIQKYGFKG